MRHPLSALNQALLLALICSLPPLSACSGAPSPDTRSGGGADTCAGGKERYLAHREQLLGRLGGCQVDADCAVLWESNACVNTCGTSVAGAELEAAASDLKSVAQTECSTCPPIPTPPCAPPGPLVCSQGRCAQR